MTSHDISPALPSYTTPGRHRRDVGPGRVRLHLRAAWTTGAAPGAVEVLLNGFPVTVTGRETTIQVPSGPLCIEVCPTLQPRSATAQVELVLGEGEQVDLGWTPPHLGLGTGRLLVESVRLGFG